MAGSLTIQGIVFEVQPVPGRMADAVTSDPAILRGVWRDVYRWDARSQTGSVLVPTGKTGAVPLANALTFYVPRVAEGGLVVKNDPASTRMAERFLALVDASSPREIVKGLGEILQQPQKSLPLAEWEALNPVASYVLRLHVGYAVVQLRHPAEDLTAYLCLPSRVRFHHEVEAILDDAAYQAALAADPDLRHKAVGAVVPSRSASNASLRKTALGKRLEEVRQALAARPDPVQQERLALLEEEWDVVTAGPARA